MKRNRNEIEAQKKTDFEHPTKRAERGKGERGREEEEKKKRKTLNFKKLLNL